MFQSEFERLVDDGKFLEHGEYDKQMYGTTITSVRNIIASGKVNPYNKVTGCLSVRLFVCLCVCL